MENECDINWSVFQQLFLVKTKDQINYLFKVGTINNQFSNEKYTVNMTW